MADEQGFSILSWLSGLDDVNNQSRLENMNTVQTKEELEETIRNTNCLDTANEKWKANEEMRKENENLKKSSLCKVCMDTDLSDVFLPCGHFVLSTYVVFLFILSLQSGQTSKRSRKRHHLKRDDVTINILLFRSGLETNPGPRNWKDLPCDVRNLGILSSCFVYGWEYYGDRLGLTEEDRDGIVAKYKRTQMQIYHMLKRAAELPENRTMRAMLTVLELCAHEFDDMCQTIDWERLEENFGAGEDDEHSGDNDSNNGGQDGPNNGLKRKTTSGSGHQIVKMQRV